VGQAGKWLWDWKKWGLQPALAENGNRRRSGSSHSREFSILGGVVGRGARRRISGRILWRADTIPNQSKDVSQRISVGQRLTGLFQTEREDLGRSVSVKPIRRRPGRSRGVSKRISVERTQPCRAVRDVGSVGG